MRRVLCVAATAAAAAGLGGRVWGRPAAPMRADGRGGLHGGSGGAASTLLPPTCGGSGEAELESLDLGAERGHLLGGAGPCGRGTPTRGGGLGSGVVSLSMLSHCWCGGASRRATASSRHLPRDRRMRSKLEREGRSNPNATHSGGCGSHFAGVGVSATTAKQENLPATRYGARLHLRNYCYPAKLARGYKTRTGCGQCGSG